MNGVQLINVAEKYVKSYVQFLSDLGMAFKEAFGFRHQQRSKEVHNSAKVIIKSHLNFEIITISQKFAKNSALDRSTVSKISLTSKLIWSHCKDIQKLLS